MPGWAAAGVRGGIPPRDEGQIRFTLKPGDDIQASIDAAGRAGGGLVLLSEGRYDVTKGIHMRDRVILRGAGPDKTILRNLLRSDFAGDNVGIRFTKVFRAALEDLTILHPAVQALNPKLYESYENHYNRIKDLRVGHLEMRFCDDCWVDNCRFLYSGTDPIYIDYCRRITMRGNVVRDCFSKGAGGEGRYITMQSEYVLFCNESVMGIRHFCLQNKSTFCVLFNCHFEVDVNFHYDTGGYNLVEGCLFQLPSGHLWRPISHGKPTWMPPGPGNLVYRLVARKEGPEGLADTPICKGVPPDPAAVFAVKSTFEEPPLLYRLDKPPPRHGTLYPVTGKCRSAQELANLYGTFAGGARPAPPAKPATEPPPAKGKPRQGAVEEDF
jgi:hypothetical protein